VASQTPTHEDQDAMRRAVRAAGLGPTSQIDRHWFRSVYVRETIGVLFGFATSGRGNASDEPLEDLGKRLVLPGAFGDRREEIDTGLSDGRIPRADLADTGDEGAPGESPAPGRSPLPPDSQVLRPDRG
jgi:glyoxalase family protein